MRLIARDFRSGALVSGLLVLPLALLEVLNVTLTRQNAPGVIILFGLLWLLPFVFFVVLLSVIRGSRSNPLVVGSKIVLLIVLALLWGSLLLDQLPCFLGVPNCD